MEATMTLPAQPKKIKKGTVIALAGGAVALIGGYFVFLYKDNDGNTFWQKWTAASADKPIEKVDEPTEATPAGSGTSRWIAESFPLRKGMFGGHIKNLQRALKIGDDGKFGTGTENAVKAKLNKTTVEKPDYDKIVNPSATGGGSNFERIKKALGSASQNISGGIRYAGRGQNRNYTISFYTNGRMNINDAASGLLYKKGAYYDGGKKIKLDDGFTVTQNNAQFAIYAIIEHIEGNA